MEMAAVAAANESVIISDDSYIKVPGVQSSMSTVHSAKSMERNRIQEEENGNGIQRKGELIFRI